MQNAWKTHYPNWFRIGSMAIRKSRSNAQLPTPASKDQARKRVRTCCSSPLENRHLMAVGPQLIGVQPNNSDLLIDGAVRTESPKELVFRFDDSQVIDPTTLSGIRITRAGGDGTFGLPTASSDFGSNGAVDIQLTSKNSALTVQVNRANLGNGAQPAFSVAGSVVSITLNSNPTTPTTALQLVTAINQSPVLTPFSAHGSMVDSTRRASA